MSCAIGRIIQFKEASKSNNISIINVNNIDITKLSKFSWSMDGVCWTNWCTYDNYILLTKNLETDFFLRILIFDSLKEVLINDNITNCYNVCFNSENAFLKNFCDSTNLFQPYNNLDCALLLQQQLADSIICMFGIPIYYFKTKPTESSANYTFKEYVLHNVQDVKQLKLMIPNGTLPSSNPKLTEFDFDWETDWETEISKTQFASAFGDTAFPTSRDFIYIPMMKRMWEVNSAYDEKAGQLMWRSTTWKLALVKFNDSTNVNADNFQDLIDNFIINKYEDVFGEIEKNEQSRLPGATPLSAPKFAATNLTDIFMSDYVRKSYDETITILNKQYNHNANIVARNLYRGKTPLSLVTYQKGICGESGTLIYILETQGAINCSKQKIIEFGEVYNEITYNETTQKFELEFNKNKVELEQFNTYMIICKWNRDMFITELNVYPYVCRENIPIYKLQPNMYKFDFESPVCELTGVYNNDYIISSPQNCQIDCWPVMLTNIKYYNNYLSKEDAIKESVKYTTTHECCVINDLARPINDGHGYNVR